MIDPDIQKNRESAKAIGLVFGVLFAWPLIAGALAAWLGLDADAAIFVFVMLPMMIFFAVVFG